jgi:leukotriene-A4 hydrolase
LISQCQAFHARLVLPCQDIPGVKSTYEFYTRSPLPVPTIGLSTGVSHFNPGKDGLGTLLYSFKQDIPIPSCLFAIASGDIATAAIGPRGTVATGPEELRDVKW